MSFNNFLIRAVLLFCFLTQLRAQTVKYLILVTRYSGDTSQGTDITVHGISQQTPAILLNNPTVGNRHNSAYGYTRTSTDVGDVCGVSMSLPADVYDGWYVGTVYIKRVTDADFKTFTFNQEMDDRAGSFKLTRSVKTNGGWSEWSEWGVCDAVCGTHGNQTRYRNCTDPRPYCGGDDCAGPGAERQRCQGPACPTTTTSLSTTTTRTTLSPTPTTTTTTTRATESLTECFTMGMIIGGVVGGFVLGVCLTAVVFMCWICKSRPEAVVTKNGQRSQVYEAPVVVGYREDNRRTTGDPLPAPKVAPTHLPTAPPIPEPSYYSTQQHDTPDMPANQYEESRHVPGNASKYDAIVGPTHSTYYNDAGGVYENPMVGGAAKRETPSAVPEYLEMTGSSHDVTKSGAGSKDAEYIYLP